MNHHCVFSFGVIMSEEKKDRFKSVDNALGRVREEFDDAIEGSRQAGGKAAKEVREAIDELEERISNLRKKD